ncbi:DUF3693 domain-containing protein [Chromobacterium vaccinii]|uniref:DUF3693 domain-containing protein n=1 Tax=Chromobacterium vaccinii TaxID=1108595 RepID=UPI0006970371|nr:DUF3693 domain-containing protein [Chromobacterium vaccinii]
MRLSGDYLREALEKMGDKSQNMKAKELMLKGNTLSQYMTGERLMDNFACMKVAQVLGIDGMEIIAAVQMEREKSEERRAFWEELRKKLGVLGLAGWVAGAALLAHPEIAKAIEINGLHNIDNLYYVKSCTCHL